MLLKILYKTTILVLILIVTSCSKNGTKRNSIYSDYIADNELVSVNKIQTFSFQGWSALDDKHLIISSHHNKSYLISLDFYCNDLKNTSNIMLDQSLSSSLSSKFDSVIVPKNKNMKCRINSIHNISKEQKQQLNSLRKNSL